MLIAMLIALAAQAPQAAPPPPPPPPKPRRICRENERRTGSHIRSSRTCKTAEQWQMDDAARDRIPPTMQIKTEQTPKPPG
jgi:hypothetical protein